MRRALLILGAVVLLSVGSACTKSKLAEGEATPTTPPTIGGATSIPATTATTAGKVLPEVCKDSDTWGLAIIKATDPTQADGLTPAQLTANLDAYAATLKEKIPEHAAEIDTRTDIAKKKLIGAATDADDEADKAAAEELNVWYVATCSPS